MAFYGGFIKFMDGFEIIWNNVLIFLLYVTQATAISIQFMHLSRYKLI